MIPTLRQRRYNIRNHYTICLFFCTVLQTKNTKNTQIERIEYFRLLSSEISPRLLFNVCRRDFLRQIPENLSGIKKRRKSTETVSFSQLTSPAGFPSFFFNFQYAFCLAPLLSEVLVLYRYKTCSNPHKNTI